MERPIRRTRLDPKIIEQSNDRFWEQFLKRLRDRGIKDDFHVVAGRNYRLAREIGPPGLEFCFLKLMDHVVGQLLFRGEYWGGYGSLLECLSTHLEAIRAEFGGEAHYWYGLSEAAVYFPIRRKGYRAIDETHWPEMHDAMIDAMERFLAVMMPIIADLP